MQAFQKEFKTLQYIIRKSDKILLVAHPRPDADTVGAVLALKEHLKAQGKMVDISCSDPFPNFLRELTSENFEYPAHLNLASYNAVIFCDAVDRAFDEIRPQISESQAVVIIDHHADVISQGDVNIIEPSYSSVCEILYNYFIFAKAPINNLTATYIMLGILGDTGNFQHANTTPRIMEIASDLMKKGANLPKIVSAVFANKKIATLKLWGKAFEKARINPKNGMIVSVLTREDIEKCDAAAEDIGQVASVLNTVPGTKFALILHEKEDGKIKGSLRSEEYKNTDVSAIAAGFGGGGHKLASGFEVKGKIVETEKGWKII
jgi:phosphoesterase RecJ-like protein